MLPFTGMWRIETTRFVSLRSPRTQDPVSSISFLTLLSSFCCSYISMAMCCEWNLAGMKQQGESFLCISIIYYWWWPFGIWIHEPVFICFFSITCTQIQFSSYVFLVSFLYCITHGLVWCTCILTCKRLKINFQKRSFFYLLCIDALFVCMFFVHFLSSCPQLYG